MIATSVTLTLANHNYPLKHLVAAAVETAALRSEQVLNGGFATSASWTFGTGWAHDAGDLEADHTAGNTAALQQNVGVVAGSLYKLVFTVKNRGAGDVTPTLGGVAGVAVSSNTTSTQYIVASTTGNLIFTPHTDFDGSIDDVSVKKCEAVRGKYRGRNVIIEAPSTNGAAVLIGDSSLSGTVYGASIAAGYNKALQALGNINLGGLYARSDTAAQVLNVLVIP